MAASQAEDRVSLANTWRTDQQSEVRDRKDRPPHLGCPLLSPTMTRAAPASLRRRKPKKIPRIPNTTAYHAMSQISAAHRRPDSTRAAQRKRLILGPSGSETIRPLISRRSFDCHHNLGRTNHQRPGCDIDDQRQRRYPGARGM